MYNGDKLLPGNSAIFRSYMRSRNDLLSYEFARRVIKEIDKCEPVGHREVVTEDGVYIPLDELAGGTKGVLCMAYEPRLRPYYYRGSGFGDNMIPYILEASKDVDIKLAVGHLLEIPDDGEIYIENTGVITHGWEEFFGEYVDARFGRELEEGEGW